MSFYIGSTPINIHESGQDFNQIENEGGEIIPSTQNTILPANTYFKNSLTVKGDPDLVEANIKKGVSLFGKTGSAEGGFPNGTEWTQSNSLHEHLESIYYANGIWVGGGETGLFYSTNGKIWTQSNITDASFIKVYNANGMWVAAGDGLNWSTYGLYYSTDGKTWNKCNILNDAVDTTYLFFNCIYYANGVWVAGGNSDLYWSEDGIDWYSNNFTLRIDDFIFNSVYYGNEFWVAGSTLIVDQTDEETNVYWSADGLEWMTTDLAPYIDISSIYYANGIWVAGSDGVRSSSGLFYSVDAFEWTQSNITSGYFLSLYNANGTWVAGGNSGLYYSTDGKTWIQSNITSGDFYDVYNANGIWVAGSDTKGLYYSIDGKTWIQSNITNTYINSIYNANGIWAADGYRFYYSVSWEPSA